MIGLLAIAAPQWRATLISAVRSRCRGALPFQRVDECDTVGRLPKAENGLSLSQDLGAASSGFCALVVGTKVRSA
jgi:hypothetical protein